MERKLDYDSRIRCDKCRWRGTITQATRDSAAKEAVCPCCGTPLVKLGWVFSAIDENTTILEPEEYSQ